MMKSCSQDIPLGDFATPVAPRDAGTESPVSGGFTAIRRWIARRRERRALGELAAFNAHLLRDIGVPVADALRESEKPFWQR
jgi:uncharacterized protein YjiS (DUF1127 family)